MLKSKVLPYTMIQQLKKQVKPSFFVDTINSL